MKIWFTKQKILQVIGFIMFVAFTITLNCEFGSEACLYGLLASTGITIAFLNSIEEV